MDAAFSSVPYPGDDHLLSRDCPAGRRLCAGLRGCPPGAVPDDLIEQHYDGLALLSPEARRYYLPAWVRTALRRPESDVAEFVLYTLGGDLHWQLTGGFTQCQRVAVVAYLESLLTRMDRIFWHLIDDALIRWQAIVPVRRFGWLGGRVASRLRIAELPGDLEPLELPVHAAQLARLETNGGILPELKRIFA